MNVLDRALHAVTDPIVGIYRDAPIVVLLVPLALWYWGWRQASHLDDVCQNLFGAFAEPFSSPSDQRQLGSDQSTILFERLPTLHEAVRICREHRYEDGEKQIELHHTIKYPPR